MKSQHAPTAAAVYSCPMHPEAQQAQPGNCPICGMQLVVESFPDRRHNNALAPQPSTTVIQGQGGGHGGHDMWTIPAHTRT